MYIYIIILIALGIQVNLGHILPKQPKASEHTFQPSDSVKSMLTTVFLSIVPDMAAPGSYTLQPRIVDTYTCGSSGEALLLPGDGFPS